MECVNRVCYDLLFLVLFIFHWFVAYYASGEGGISHSLYTVETIARLHRSDRSPAHDLDDSGQINSRFVLSA